MKKVIVVSASSRVIGGHSVQAEVLIRGLRQSGYAVSWLSVDRSLGWVRKIRFLRTIANELLYLVQLVQLARADIVHIFAASYWSFLLGPAPAVLVAKIFRKRVILNYHSGEADDHLTRWPLTTRAILSIVDSIVVPSSYLRRVFASHGFDARVIPNCIDTSEFPFRPRFPLKPRLLSVRSLERLYCIENTITAFADIKKHFADATLVIAGCGPEEKALRTLTESRGISDVHFAGGVPRASLASLYDAADIFVNSSVIDNQPVSILEAFAAGLCVVSTPIGDIPAMLCDGAAGVLVPAADPAEMARAVIELNEKPALAQRLADRAYEEVKRYRAETVIGQWSALYSDRSSQTAGGGITDYA